jgi:hypothetical protein
MQQLARWHQTRAARSLFAAIELALTYVSASLAIDQGSLWLYGISLLLLAAAIHNCIKLVWGFVHGNKPAEAQRH